RPGGSEKKNAEHGHFFCSFAGGFDQIFASQIMARTKRLVVIPTAPAPSIGLEKAVRLWKFALLKLTNRLHGSPLQLGPFHVVNGSTRSSPDSLAATSRFYLACRSPHSLHSSN